MKTFCALSLSALVLAWPAALAGPLTMPRQADIYAGCGSAKNCWGSEQGCIDDAV